MVRKTVSQAIKAFDFFCQPATFRYGDQPDYQSLTGGICSIIIFIVFAVLFTNHIIETFNKVNIESTYTTIQQQDPSYYQIGTDNFMFAIQIKDMDMNQGQMYFSVLMEKIDITGTSPQNKTRVKQVVKLQKCQKQQWTAINPNMSSTFDKLEFSKWLCPPNETRIQLQGKFSSDIFRYYKIGIKQCSLTEAASLNRTCAASDKIEKYLNASESFVFNYYYINTIINPSNHQFIQTYLDDLNYFYFTTTDGVTANFFLSNYEIETDQSIYPVVQNKTVRGAISTTPAQTINFKLRTSTQYMKFYIRKSSLSIKIERSFKKLQATLSYIGGLFSAILSALFIIKKYNQLSYEMQIAKNLYHYDKNQPLKSESFNFLVFVGYLIYAFFEMIRIKLPWDRMEVYFRSLEEVRKQMDIRLVMKKILYSQRMAIAVFDQPKAKILHLQQPLTLQQAQRIRKDHRFYDKLEKKYFDYKKIKEQQELQNAELDQNIQMQITQQQANKSAMKKVQGPVTIQQIVLPQQKQGKPININRNLSRRRRINLKSYYNKRKQATKQERAKDNLSKIFNFTKSQKKRKQQQMNRMIEQMKTYVMILKEEAQNGDVVSQHILDRFDPKLMKMFMLNESEQKTEEKKREMSISNYTIDLIPQKKEKGESPFSSSSIIESRSVKK